MITRISTIDEDIVRNVKMKNGLTWDSQEDMANKFWESRLSNKSISSFIDENIQIIYAQRVVTINVYSAIFSEKYENRVIDLENLYRHSNLLTLFKIKDDKLSLLTVRGKTLDEFKKIGVNTYGHCYVPIVIYKKDGIFRALNGLHK